MPVNRTPEEKKIHSVYMRTWYGRKRLDTLSFLGGLCVCEEADCSFHDGKYGITNPSILQIDHINGGGSKHRQKIGFSQQAIADAVSKNPHMYQILCANCNWMKRFRLSEHKKSG